MEGHVQLPLFSTPPLNMSSIAGISLLSKLFDNYESYHRALLGGMLHSYALQMTGVEIMWHYGKCLAYVKREK